MRSPSGLRSKSVATPSKKVAALSSDMAERGQFCSKVGRRCGRGKARARPFPSPLSQPTRTRPRYSTTAREMAKFGLSDSEESDSDQQYSTTQSPPPPSRRSTSRSYDSQQEEEEQATDEDMDQQEEEEDEAPPRASLFNEQDQTTEDEGEEEEDHSMASSSRRASTALYSATHSPSSSAASSSSATPPPPPAPATRQRTQDQPWAAKLKLEPKRVAVMQASLFQQQDKVEESTTASAKDSKQKQAIASFASRPGVQPAASPFAVSPLTSGRPTRY